MRRHDCSNRVTPSDALLFSQYYEIVCQSSSSGARTLFAGLRWVPLRSAAFRASGKFQRVPESIRRSPESIRRVPGSSGSIRRAPESLGEHRRAL
eukprot:12509015-Alexandrium_andersonii.AAC.1